MELAICSFASSSAGNSFLIQSQSTRILADIGISAKKTEESLAACGLSCAELDGIVLTHEHIDHVRGIGTLLAKKPYRSPVFTTRGTCESVAQKYPQTERKQFEIVRSGDRFLVGDIEVNVFRISHDAAEPVGYNVFSGEKKITLATDIGHVTDTIRESIEDSDVLLLEANHDVEMLKKGGYPWSLKQRILGENGHLSNHTAGRLLAEVMTGKMKYVFLGHLSEENNNPHLAYETVEEILRNNRIEVGTHVKMDMASRFQNGVKVEL